MLLQQLAKANTEASFFKDNITTLKQCVTEANNVKKNCLNDNMIEKDLSLKKEKLLTVEIDKMKGQNMQLANELDKAGSELIYSLKESTILNEHIKQLEDEMNNERLAREKERAALSIALDGIDSLTSQIDELKLKDNEREIALDIIAKLEREKESIRYENFELQQDIMKLRSEAEEADEKNSENILQIENLENFKIKYDNNNELNLLKNKIIELNDKVISSTAEIESMGAVSAVRMSSSGKEIERLALDLLNAQRESMKRDEVIMLLKNELNELQLKCKLDEEMRLSVAATTVIVAQSAETKLTINELILSLQTNRQLNDELVVLKNRLDNEQNDRIAHDELALLSVTNKAKEVDNAIECSKSTLYRAVQEVDNMKKELQSLGNQRDELGRQLELAELQSTSLRVALAAAISEGEKNAIIRTAMHNEIQKLTFDKETATEAMVRAVAVSASTVATAAADNTRICTLRTDLERMTQLKEIAEGKVAALTLAATTIRQAHAQDIVIARANRDHRHDRANISEDGSTITEMRHDKGYFTSHSEYLRHPDLTGHGLYNRPSGRSQFYGDQGSEDSYDGVVMGLGSGSGPGGRHQQDMRRADRGRATTPTNGNEYSNDRVPYIQHMHSESLSPQPKHVLGRSQNADVKNDRRSDPKSVDPSYEHGLSDNFTKPVLRTDASHAIHSRGGAGAGAGAGSGGGGGGGGVGGGNLKDIGNIVHLGSPERIRHDKSEISQVGSIVTDLKESGEDSKVTEERRERIEKKDVKEIKERSKEKSPVVEKSLSNDNDVTAKREREILLNKILYGDTASSGIKNNHSVGCSEEKNNHQRSQIQDKNLEKGTGNHTQIKNVKTSTPSPSISKIPVVKHPWLVSKVKGENWNYSPTYSNKKGINRGGEGGGAVEDDLLNSIGDYNSSSPNHERSPNNGYGSSSSSSLSSGLNIGTIIPSQPVGGKSRNGSPLRVGGSGSPSKDLGSSSHDSRGGSPPKVSSSGSGSPGKERLDAAGLHSTEMRSLDDHFLHH